MHDVEVIVISPEAAQDGVAEFRCGGELIAATRLIEGELILEFEPRTRERPLTVSARSLATALLHARRLLD